MQEGGGGVCVCMCEACIWTALCNDCTSLWEQLVSGVSARHGMNFVSHSNSGTAFGPSFKDIKHKSNFNVSAM